MSTCGIRDLAAREIKAIQNNNSLSFPYKDYYKRSRDSAYIIYFHFPFFATHIHQRQSFMSRSPFGCSTRSSMSDKDLSDLDPFHFEHAMQSIFNISTLLSIAVKRVYPRTPCVYIYHTYMY